MYWKENIFKCFSLSLFDSSCIAENNGFAFIVKLETQRPWKLENHKLENIRRKRDTNNEERSCEDLGKICIYFTRYFCRTFALIIHLAFFKISRSGIFTLMGDATSFNWNLTRTNIEKKFVCYYNIKISELQNTSKI